MILEPSTKLLIILSGSMEIKGLFWRRTAISSAEIFAVIDPAAIDIRWPLTTSITVLLFDPVRILKVPSSRIVMRDPSSLFRITELRSLFLIEIPRFES